MKKLRLKEGSDAWKEVSSLREKVDLREKEIEVLKSELRTTEICRRAVVETLNGKVRFWVIVSFTVAPATALVTGLIIRLS